MMEALSDPQNEVFRRLRAQGKNNKHGGRHSKFQSGTIFKSRRCKNIIEHKFMWAPQHIYIYVTCKNNQQHIINISYMLQIPKLWGIRGFTNKSSPYNLLSDELPNFDPYHNIYTNPEKKRNESSTTISETEFTGLNFGVAIYLLLSAVRGSATCFPMSPSTPALRERSPINTNLVKYPIKKMQPTNPNAHTYVSGTDVETWICSHVNSLVHFPLLPYQCTVECGILKRVAC